jgi:sugar lactone lactonase YvrE
MKKIATLIGIIIFTIFILIAVVFNFYNCARTSDFPVKPTLFVDSTFDRAEGIAFNGDGELYVAANRALWRLDTEGNATKLADLYTNLGVAAIGEHDLLVADFGPTNRFNHGPNEDGIIWRITPEGQKRIASTGGMGDPNFIVVRKDGSYLVSDDATNEIFLVDRNGEVSLFTDSISHPNGMVISPDGRILYVAQIFKSLNPTIWDNRIWRIPLDENGTPAKIPKVITTMEGEFAGPDGLAMDTLGRLYATLPRRGELWRIDPVTGEKQLIADGMPGIASIAFGRGDFDRHAIYGASTRRGGGRIWKVNVGVKGITLNR